MHICISYSLAYLKYLNKYVLTTNVSAYVKYVNTFACQNYLCKIVVLYISIFERVFTHEAASSIPGLVNTFFCSCFTAYHQTSNQIGWLSYPLPLLLPQMNITASQSSSKPLDLECSSHNLFTF